MRMLYDIGSLWKSFVVNLAVTAIWYAAEYEQFGTLQWDRWSDNIISVIYMVILWWVFRKIDKRGGSNMITIENMDEYSREIRKTRARDIRDNCKATGNCDTCRDKERGQPCPYTGNPVNWRV